MKASELMIGDYVIRKNVPKEILIVVAIDSIRNMVYLDLNGLGITEKIENIEPIPLTTKIMDKNFTYDYGVYLITDNDYIEVSIMEYNDGLWQIAVDEIEMSGLPTWRMFVSNVHELQHALRLCGIDKTIEL